MDLKISIDDQIKEAYAKLRFYHRRIGELELQKINDQGNGQ